MHAAGQQLLNISRNESKHIEGKNPRGYDNLAQHSTWANVAVGLQTQQEYQRLEEYLKLIGGYQMHPVQMRDACMFSSIRRGTDVPLEFSNTHLRRQITVTIVENIKFIFPLMSHIRLSTDDYNAKCRDKSL